MSISVRRCVTEADLAVSVGIYNEVLPRYAVTVEEAVAWASAADDAAEFLAADTEAEAASAAVMTRRDDPNAFFLLTVSPAHRRRGAGTALLATISAWATEHGRTELETYVASD